MAHVTWDRWERSDENDVRERFARPAEGRPLAGVDGEFGHRWRWGVMEAREDGTCREVATGWSRSEQESMARATAILRALGHTVEGDPKPPNDRPAWDRWLHDALVHQAGVDEDNGTTEERRAVNTRFAALCRSVARQVLERGTEAFDWPPTPAQTEIDAVARGALTRVLGYVDQACSAVGPDDTAARGALNRLRNEIETLRGDFPTTRPEAPR